MTVYVNMTVYVACFSQGCSLMDLYSAGHITHPHSAGHAT